jgi:hypothetical protein
VSVRPVAETWVTVTAEGGLLLPDTLGKVATENAGLGGLRPEDYGLPKTQRLTERISAVWSDVRAHWRSFQISASKLPESDRGTTDTREWMRKLFRELGYDLTYRAAAEEIEGTRYPISHRAGDSADAPPIHIVSFRQELNRPAPSAEDAGKRSPHGLMQGYLNAEQDHQLWGIVANGKTVRLLRDSHHFGRQSYLEFDLEAMLEGEVFSDFMLLYLLLHRSRLPQPGQPAAECWLESWRSRAESEGTRARDALRNGVEEAITALGTGLMVNAHNVELKQRLSSPSLAIDAYYRQLLKLVYRLLFLLVAEERDLLFTSDADNADARARYDRHYGVSRLRRLAERSITARDSRQTDLWRSLLVTFDAMRDPAKAHALGLEPLGGGLFDTSSCPDLTDETQGDANSRDPYDIRPMITNEYLLRAIRGLSLNTSTTPFTRVNYRDMDVEELGSVYESLLDQEPSYSDTGEFIFRKSNERKSTGSYYTPSSLVRELVNSALVPVVSEALERGRTPEEKRQNLLSLKVCDPACGSGHFLLAAARRIGHELAQIDAGEGAEPDPETVRESTREVIRHCIYGVDKNPLAIDLCKVALWIEGHSAGHPIGFLDSHVKVGDSLVGMFDLEALQTGVPDDAYKSVTGDDKKVAAGIKKKNAQEKKGQRGLWETGEERDILGGFTKRLAEIEAMPEESVEDVAAIAKAYEALHRRDDWNDISLACDLWTWAFFAPMQDQSTPSAFPSNLIPTTGIVKQAVARGPKTLDGRLVGAATKDAWRIGFFHWPLQFPEVFTRGNAGFDAVLGNPPWERVKLQEKEFFAERSPEIATAPNKAARDRLIKAEEKKQSPLWFSFVDAKRTAENASLFMRTSERFPLTGRGDVNLYSVFAEQFRRMTSLVGRAGIIVPSGIATDNTNRHFFGSLISSSSILSLYSFENEAKIFPTVHNEFKFCLLTTGNTTRDRTMTFVFFARYLSDIHDAYRRIELSVEDFERLNPNTLTCPTFRTAREAEITSGIYSRLPVLVNERTSTDPWGVSFKSMFHMSNDSGVFRTADQLEGQGLSLTSDGRFQRVHGTEVANGPNPGSDAVGNKVLPQEEIWLPLYEGKMIHQFDHRYGTYEGQSEAQARKGVLPQLDSTGHQDLERGVLARYWVSENDVRKSVGDHQWYMGFRDITNSVSVRTAIFSLLPRVAVNHKTPLMFLAHDARRTACFLGNCNSFVFDFVTRQKIGGVSLGFFILKQLTVVPPETFAGDLLEAVTERIMELTYTTHDLAPFALDCGYDGPPFIWDEERRAHLRAELDGIYAHLYGLSRDDFEYILGTFPIVERNDIKEHGEFRTKRLCLKAYDRFANDPAVVAARPEVGVA